MKPNKLANIHPSQLCIWDGKGGQVKGEGCMEAWEGGGSGGEGRARGDAGGDRCQRREGVGGDLKEARDRGGRESYNEDLHVTVM